MQQKLKVQTYVICCVLNHMKCRQSYYMLCIESHIHIARVTKKHVCVVKCCWILSFVRHHASVHFSQTCPGDFRHTICATLAYLEYFHAKGGCGISVGHTKEKKRVRRRECKRYTLRSFSLFFQSSSSSLPQKCFL